MTDTLIVQLVPPLGGGDDDEQGFDCAARWLHMPAESTPDTLEVESGVLSQLLKEPPADCRWIVLLPGEEVLTKTVSLPRKRRRQALKALPFMLEDSIASDIRQEHLAVGPDNEQGETLVAITRKQGMDELLRLFADAGISPSKILPDYAILPENPGCWQVLLNGERVLVRCPDNTGYSTPLSKLTFLLNSAQDADSDTPPALVWIRSADTSVPELPGNWQVSEQVVETPLRQFLAGAAQASLNLLQGEYKITRQDELHWRRWTLAAVFAIVAVLIGLLETGLDTVRLNRENAQLQASMFDLAREALPGVQQIRDPQTQVLIAWRQLENSGTGGTDFLSLLNRVSPTINQQPVTVHGIYFRDGALTVALRGSSLQQLDSLRQQIEQLGLYAALLNVGTEAESARSNLLIRTENPENPRSAG